MHIYGHAGSISLDLHLEADGKGEGTMTVSGFKIGIARIGDEGYFKSNEAFWKKYANTAAPKLAGRWIEMSAVTGPLASLAELMDMHRLLSAALASHSSKLSVGGLTSVNGERVIPVRDVSQSGVLDVAASGSAYPVAIVGQGSKLSLGSWNAPLTVTVPPNAVNLSALAGNAPIEIPGLGVSVVLPAGWRGAPFPGSSANSAYKYLARAPQTLGVRGTFLAGLASIPKGLTLEQVFFSGSSAAWRYVGRTQAVTINGAPGIYYHSTKAVVAGSEAILTDVWAFDRHGQMFFFIFEGPASLSSEYNPVFAQSAATIHFSATSGTTSA